MADRTSFSKWMKKGFLATFAILATALLAGCFQSERTVRLNGDGSGTIEEVVLISKALTGMFDAVEGGDEAAKTGRPEPKKKDQLAEQEKEARAKLSTMGEGVSLVSVTSIQRGDFEGYRALYQFRDINKLNLPSDPTPGSKGAGSGKATTYRFTRGEHSVLVVTNGSADTKDGKPGKTDSPAAEESHPVAEEPRPAAGESSQAEQEAAMQMLKQMFGGMRISEKLIVEGTIIESNALFRSGSEITVVDVDFGQLLSTNPEELMKLQSVPQDDKQKLLMTMSKIQGFKIDMNDELRVVFRKK